MSKLCLALAISLLVLVACSNESEVISSEPITEPPESPVISQSPSPSLSRFGAKKKPWPWLKCCGEKREVFPLIRKRQLVCGVF